MAYQTVFEGQMFDPQGEIERLRLKLIGVRTADELSALWAEMPARAKAQLALVFEDVERKLSDPQTTKAA